jgi:deoxycytidylate deaminase
LLTLQRLMSGELSEREARKLATMWHFAEELGGLTTCKRARVGCVVLPLDFSQVAAIGYNGPAAGLPNDSCTGADGSCGCAHAEVNALVKLRWDAGAGLLMLCTKAPCLACASATLNSRRVSAVVWGRPSSDAGGLHALGRGRVATGQIDTLLDKWRDKWTRR